MDTPSPSADVQRTSGDAFDILRLEPKFDLDAKLLAERHRALSLALHPDRFAGRPSAERRLALEQAMQVNSAFRTLKDPIARAELLAQRRGIALSDAHRASPEFLERTMERRERLADAILDGDLTRVTELARLSRSEQAELCLRLDGLLSGNGSKNADDLADTLSSLRFLRRFIDSAEAELEAHST